MNLNTYDFGARHYDPVLGRWTAIDLLAERSVGFSPYNYVEDNPMNLMDPDGMQPKGAGGLIKDSVMGEQTINCYEDLGAISVPGNSPGWSIGLKTAGKAISTATTVITAAIEL